jgi:soluble lytic murein transglycosylase
VQHLAALATKPGEKCGLVLQISAALLAVGCAVSPLPISPSSAREQALDRAFALAESDPGRAALLFAEAGPGATLERARMAVWEDCLERAGATPEAWRRYLADSPPDDLAGTARLWLMKELAENGDLGTFLDQRTLLPAELRPRADEFLLDTPDPEIRFAAARRLVVTGPQRLAAHDRTLDRRLLATLSPRDHLERARQWRRAGAPSRAAAELRSVQWTGDIETERKRELARAELAAGSPLAALRALPSGRNPESEDLALRAQAYRNRAWHLFPGRGETKAFGNCQQEAERALDKGSSANLHLEVLGLRLECATEAGRLDDALESWWMLEAARSDDPRRKWLGRRLGVALTRRGGKEAQVLELARSMPTQRRCLQYWAAVTAPDGVPRLERLATAEVADLYAVWSRETLHRPSPVAVDLAQIIKPALPPPSVQRLIDVGAPSEAVRQWRRVRRRRGALPDESVAAAALAAGQGFTNDAIRWLLAGFPELGTIQMAKAPSNAIRAYLPLRWPDAITAAARESGLDPWLIAAVARQESTFSANAISPRGARGVLQLLPSTARSHAVALGLGKTPDLHDPDLNIRLGARELGRLMRRFESVEPALAAYNGGETRVRGWWKRWPDPHRFTEEIPVPETYNYVRRVIYLSEAYRLVHQEAWRSQ